MPLCTPRKTISHEGPVFNPGFVAISIGCTRAVKEAEPRVGVAYQRQENQHRVAGILRSYSGKSLQRRFDPFGHRVYRTLSLSLIGSVAQGFLARAVQSSPGLRHEFHAGLQQAFGRYFVVSGEYIWKYTHNAYDFSVLGNTPITFPIDWHNSKIPGYALCVICRTSTA